MRNVKKKTTMLLALLLALSLMTGLAGAESAEKEENALVRIFEEGRALLLETDNVTLTAEYQQMYDLAAVKEVALANGMAKPVSGQVYYMDLSSGDSAVVYQTESPNVLSRLLTSLHHGVYAVVEYFN